MSESFNLAVGMVLQRNGHTEPDRFDTRWSHLRIMQVEDESIMGQWLDGENAQYVTIIPRQDITDEWFIPD